MMRLATCLYHEHDPRLLALAVAICVIGSLTTVRLLRHSEAASGTGRLGWMVLTSVALGAMVWSTHFVSMMAFKAPATVMLDPTLTLLSLLIAMLTALPGVAAALARDRRIRATGGGLIGLSIAAMHYAGMAAFQVDGVVTWDAGYVAASIVLSVTLGALALAISVPGRSGIAATLPALPLGLAVVLLHFTGMTAMMIMPSGRHGPGPGLGASTMTVLGVATGFAALLVIGCALTTLLIDSHTRSESCLRLNHTALHDSLTGLPNRLWFDQELHRLLALRTDCGLAAIMIDLAHFKRVNDTHGHRAGDQLLVRLAERFSALPDAGGTVSRLGGDEFAILLPFRDRGEVDLFLQLLCAAFLTPFVLDCATVACSANIGVALAPADGSDPDTLIGNADLAMYRGKRARSPAPSFYEHAMDGKIRERRDLGSQLQAAIGTGAFELHYQPQVAIATGEIIGYEALLRWTHPSLGPVPPAIFIPLAEENGHIVELGTWVLRQACLEAAGWGTRHTVAINLSPLQLSDPNLIPTVRHVLAGTGLDPARLELELTESAVIGDRRHAERQLLGLRQMGVGLALDDFGVGYSSLDVLRSLPFTRIKLDSSFMAGIESSSRGIAILNSVATLGTKLGMQVLAEGIERPEQLAMAAREGCSAVQGYLLGRPARIPADAQDVRARALEIIGWPGHPPASVPTSTGRPLTTC